MLLYRGELQALWTIIRVEHFVVPREYLLRLRASPPTGPLSPNLSTQQIYKIILSLTTDFGTNLSGIRVDSSLRNSSVEMSQAVDTSHPYFPQDASIPNYIPNTASLEVILRDFGTLIVVIVTSGLYLAKYLEPDLHTNELAAIAWFLLCKSDAARATHVCSQTWPALSRLLPPRLLRRILCAVS